MRVGWICRRCCVAAVVGVVAAVVVDVQPAQALAGVPAPITQPASVIAGIIGDVLPDAGGAEAAGMTLDTGSSGLLNVMPKVSANYDCATVVGLASGNCNITQLKTVAKELPGFQLGFKIGGWVDQLTGELQTGNALHPDPNFVPYADAQVAAQWSPNVWPVTMGPTTDQTSASGVYVDGDSNADAYGKAATAGLALHGVVSVSSAYNHGAVTFTMSYGINCLTNDPANPVVRATSSTTGGIVSGAGAFTFTHTFDSPVCVPGSSAAGGAGYSYEGFDSFDHVSVYLQDNSDDAVTFQPASKWLTAGYGGASAGGATTADPDRTWVTTVRCQDKTGGPLISVTGISPKFREDAAEFPAYPIAQCPDGTFPVGAKVDLTGNDPAVPLAHINTITVPKVVTDWATAHPNCWQGNCPVALEQLMPDGSWRSCFVNEDGCSDWLTRADKASAFRCTQDNTVLPLSDCNFYSPTFDPVARGKGISYANPKDGVAVKPSTAPVDNPISVSQSIPDPVGGGGSSDCFPSGWTAFNPVEWVLQPIKCAFIPQTGSLTKSLTQAKELLTTRPPFSVVIASWPFLAGFVTGFETDCTTHLADFGDGLVIPCTVPGNPAWFRLFYFGESAVVIGGGVFATWRIASRMLSKNGS